MAKITLVTIQSGYYTLNQLNNNFDSIEAALEKCVYRDGSTPNAMENDLDMGGWNILNVNNITSASEVSATNTANLGGYAAAEYPRKDENATITGDWTFTGTVSLGATVVQTDQPTEFAAPITTTPVALVTGATVTPDCDDGNYFTLVPDQNFTLANPSNAPTGAMTILVRVWQGATPRTISWGSAYKFAGGTAPTLSTGAYEVDLVSATYDPTLNIWMTTIYKDIS